jgi:ABC-type branched-subunit amino acid transport system substrate-binding protein
MKNFWKILFLLFVLSFNLFAQDTLLTKKLEVDSKTLDSLVPSMKLNNNLYRSQSEAIDSVEAIVDSQEVKFYEGVDLYNRQRYLDALNIFQEVNSIPVDENRFYTASSLMLIKTYLKLGEINKCITLGEKFESDFEGSKYYDDVKYTLGEAYFRQSKYKDALLSYFGALESSDDKRLENLSKQVIDKIIDLFITTAELGEIKEQLSGSESEILVTLKLAEKYYSEGNKKLADREMRSIWWDVRGSRYKEDYLKVSEQSKSPYAQRVYIGVILPLSGSMEDIGKDMLNGIRYSLHQFRMTSNIDIAAIVMDNRGDAIRTIKQLEYLINNPKVVAVFGPISSENAIPMVALANNEKIPVITPTATNSNLTELGPYTFQSNVDIRNLGRFIAIYCIKTSAKTVATLSPADSYGKEITDAFCETIDELGGRVITQQWYNNEPVDLKFQFNNIRREGLKLAREQLNAKVEAMKDSMLNIVNSDSSIWHTDTLYFFASDSIYELFTPNGIIDMSLKEALIYTGLMKPEEFVIPDKEDSPEFAIKSIDALFLPSHASDVKYIIPQLAFYNIETHLLGNANWGDLPLLNRNSQLLDDLKFVSDYFIDSESEGYKKFESQYYRMTGKKPGRFDLYGYDTMNALLSAFENGEISRESIRRNLNNMPTYYGICRNISFKGNRPGVNSCAFILFYKNRKIHFLALVENDELLIIGE